MSDQKKNEPLTPEKAVRRIVDLYEEAVTKTFIEVFAPSGYPEEFRKEIVSTICSVARERIWDEYTSMIHQLRAKNAASS